MSNNVKPEVESLRNARILFGHQSVGQNILDGLRELAADSGVAGLKIESPQETHGAAEGFVATAFIGENGDPGSKCTDLMKVIQTYPPDGLDVVLMKFCHADFTPETNVAEMFQLYRRTVESVRVALPNAVIVHCTAPLTTRTPWWKRFIKWVLRRYEFSDGGNILRKQYNDMLRQEYKDEPIFDIAAIESTLPGGKRTSFKEDDQVIYVLADEYAEGGGHLNRLGRAVAAREFLRVTAEAMAMKGTSQTSAARTVSRTR